jgi:hypothetical protein
VYLRAKRRPHCAPEYGAQVIEVYVDEPATTGSAWRLLAIGATTLLTALLVRANEASTVTAACAVK